MRVPHTEYKTAFQFKSPTKCPLEKFLFPLSFKFADDDDAAMLGDAIARADGKDERQARFQRHGLFDERLKSGCDNVAHRSIVLTIQRRSGCV